HGISAPAMPFRFLPALRRHSSSRGRTWRSVKHPTIAQATIDVNIGSSCDEFEMERHERDVSVMKFLQFGTCVQLPALLIDVDQLTGFSHEFTQASGTQPRNPDLTRNLYASLIAYACTLGYAGMADAAGISEETWPGRRSGTNADSMRPPGQRTRDGAAAATAVRR